MKKKIKFTPLQVSSTLFTLHLKVNDLTVLGLGALSIRKNSDKTGNLGNIYSGSNHIKAQCFFSWCH
jgi:hypothetical protein